MAGGVSFLFRTEGGLSPRRPGLISGCASARVACRVSPRRWLGVGMCEPRDGLAGSRPGGRGTFFCFAKRKYPKKRRAGCVVPALRAGHAALLGQRGKRRNSPCGLRHLRFSFRAVLRYSPPHTAVGQGGAEDRRRAGQRVFGFRGSVFPLPCVCAEERRPGRIQGCACLSPQGEFAQTPARASTAGCPGYAGVTDTRVAFSLPTFFWRRKRK